ncbi:hypothetical protein [Nesterenkonia ebinurensis]|uniref:hypothetical protein n=1 Tax=Nesterenkonia ebinurensis TaxID=2608252 RepID=UPI00123D41EA|nr:hypothetical protein [Nesterenkonia ebinurensis]
MTETQHPSNDLLLDVVLGHAPADANGQVARHLSECGPCRTTYDELHSALESVLPAAPEATVPVGFDSRVLARLHPSETSSAAAWTRPGRHRSRTMLTAAAACALGIVIGGAGVYSHERSFSDETEPSAASGEYSAELVTADGEAVGWAATGYDAEGPVLVLTVEEASAGATYTCRGVFEDHSTEVLAEWTIYDDQANIWVLEDSDEPLRALELVDDSGRVWAQAEW